MGLLVMVWARMLMLFDIRRGIDDVRKIVILNLVVVLVDLLVW